MVGSITSKQLTRRLKLVIEDSGLALSEFAERVGVSRNTLIRYRDDQRSIPIDFLYRVSDAFSVEIRWLVAFEGRDDDPRYILYTHSERTYPEALDSLILEVSKELGIVLMPGPRKEFKDLLQREAWPEFRTKVAELLRAMVHVTPSWRAKSPPPPTAKNEDNRA